MRKKTVVIAAIIVITMFTGCKNSADKISTEEKADVTKTLYRLDRRPYDETMVDDEMIERALANIESHPEYGVGTPSIEDLTYREWRKQTAIFNIKTTAKSEAFIINNYLKQQDIYKSVPDIVTYYNGYPFIRYYEDEKSGKAAFVASLSYDGSPISRIYCGTAYIEDFKKEGSIVYNFDQNSRLLSEKLYNNQDEQITSLSYTDREGMPFPVITEYDNITGGEGYFYSNVYLNTGQRFWVYDSLLEFGESGRWSKYNGNIYNDPQNRGDIERYNTPVYNEDGRLEKIIETLRGSQYQDNPDEWIEDGRINFQYNDSGSLTEVSYGGFSGNHGSSGNTGSIMYDEIGRVVHIDSFHSSGDYHYFFLYQNEETTPCAIFEIGGMAYSGDNTDDYYMLVGMDFDAWLFLDE